MPSPSPAASQDPLAELVKIDRSPSASASTSTTCPSSLARSLDAVVEDCVNAVGVDVNTASAALLARISGLNATLAQNIVQFRDANGAFKSRSELKRSRAWARRPSNRPPAFSA